MTPFIKGKSLLEYATPMDDVLGHIASQLAELELLKGKEGKSHVRTE